MTTEKKTNSEDKLEKCFGFSLKNREAMCEMMRNCCSSETKGFDCCSMMQMMRGRKSDKSTADHNG
jgi:hypothetical protein